MISWRVWEGKLSLVADSRESSNGPYRGVGGRRGFVEHRKECSLQVSSKRGRIFGHANANSTEDLEKIVTHYLIFGLR